MEMIKALMIVCFYGIVCEINLMWKLNYYCPVYNESNTIRSMICGKDHRPRIPKIARLETRMHVLRTLTPSVNLIIVYHLSL